MKTEDSFYVQILLWAYDKTAVGVGFTEHELLTHFDLKNGMRVCDWPDLL